jgi:RNA-directed DNA polymerase
MCEKVTVSTTQRCDWDAINWQLVIPFVRQLRHAIFRAAKEENLKKVRTLQRIMLRSYENRVLAVQRVTQTNRGKYTPGIDGLVVATSEERAALVDRLAEFEPWKPLPARRLYIPKANGKLRPLGIPVVIDRILQVMVKNALEPFWEAKFEDSSYGFRPGRSCHDAIQRVFNYASGKRTRRWILDADIKGAFDNIDHDKLLDLIGNFPARELIRQWLKAGYLEDGVFHDTDRGTPQGGVISPLLANIAFHGMEEVLGVRYLRHSTKSLLWELHPRSVGLVRYADDFVVCCHSNEEAEEASQKLKTWFADRGLTFSEEKTRITNLDEGFDFLGFNVRRYEVTNSRTGFRLLMRPSKASVQKQRRKLRETFRECRGDSAATLITRINPIIRGWTNYFRAGASKRTFSKLDNYLFTLQRIWVRWRHPSKSWAWVKRRYWGRCPCRTESTDLWVFLRPGGAYMIKHAWTPIWRHVMVRRFASKDDPDLVTYWNARMRRGQGVSLTPFQRRIAVRQNWQCPFCGDYLNNGMALQEHCIAPARDGGSGSPNTFLLIHCCCCPGDRGQPQPPT